MWPHKQLQSIALNSRQGLPQLSPTHAHQRQVHLEKGSTSISCAKGWMGEESREAAAMAPFSSRPTFARSLAGGA